MAERVSEPKLPRWLVVWLARHTPACQEIARLVSAGLDRPLTWREVLSMRAHYAICFLCRRYEHQVRLLHQNLARNPESFSECSGATLSAEEKDRLKKACTSAAD